MNFSFFIIETETICHFKKKPCEEEQRDGGMENIRAIAAMPKKMRIRQISG
tara:strand:- start:50 stop:202 length:153 start_codon:yes stop_codon:yes gene_type:complete